MYWLLLFLSVSYWYCLPVASTRIFGYTEFRGYDFLLIGLAACLLYNQWGRVRDFFQTDKPGYWLVRFCLWASVMATVSVIWHACHANLSMAGVTVMDLFHLWGFLLGYAAFRMYLRTREQCLRLLDVFLVVGIIEATIICLQSLHIVPIFWSSLYRKYGPMVFSGTLGMNRALPGHVMILLFAVAFTYACNWRAIGHWRMIVAIIAAVVSVSGIMVSGSRTAWSTFLVFIVVTFFNRRLALPAMVFVGGVAAIFLATAPDALTDRGREMFEYRLSSKLERVQGDEVLDHFQAVDAGRYKIWMSAITTFIEKPWVIPCGVGFIGYNRLDTRGSAHNIFLTLIGELGVIGLFLYLMWFRELWRRGNDLLIKQRLRTGVRTHFFCPTGVKPLLACLSFSLLGGEILYVYRPSFAFLGMFLFICAVMTHPTLVSASSALRQSAPPKVSAYRRAGHGAKRCDTVRGIKQANWPRRLFEIRKNYAITSKPFHKA